jgi:hypothetical protein
LIVLALAVAACGGGSDNKSDNASATSDTTTAPSGANASFSDVCDARAAFSAPNPATFTSGDVKDAMQKAAANLDKAKSLAPAEIKSDVVIVVDAAKPYFSLLASVNYDFMKLANDPSKQQELQALAAKFDDAKVKAASERINAWVAAHCH